MSSHRQPEVPAAALSWSSRGWRRPEEASSKFAWAAIFEPGFLELQEQHATHSTTTRPACFRTNNLCVSF